MLYFCFGFETYRGDTESFDNANRMSIVARTKTDYFLSENLKELKEEISLLKDEKLIIYCNSHYTGTTVIKSWSTKKGNWINCPESEIVTNENRMLLLKAYEKELEQFTKRLNVYLKKYGLTKINSYSYWRD